MPVSSGGGYCSLKAVLTCRPAHWTYGVGLLDQECRVHAEHPLDTDEAGDAASLLLTSSVTPTGRGPATMHGGKSDIWT